MDLLLWRHAEAEIGKDDLARALTHKGRVQAQRIAAWLEQVPLPGLMVVASPAVRTCQTAAALRLPVKLDARLAPDQEWSALLACAGLDGWGQAGAGRLGDFPGESAPRLLVGHQPTLGRAAAVLLTGQPLPWSVRKGSLWWISCRHRDGQTQTVLRHVIDPDRPG